MSFKGKVKWILGNVTWYLNKRSTTLKRTHHEACSLTWITHCIHFHVWKLVLCSLVHHSANDIFILISISHTVYQQKAFFSTTFSHCYLTLNDCSNVLWFICMQFSSSLGTVVPHWCRCQLHRQIGILSKTEHKWCREERLLHASRTCFLGNFRTYKTVIASFGSRTQSLRTARDIYQLACQKPVNQVNAKIILILLTLHNKHSC